MSRRAVLGAGCALCASLPLRVLGADAPDSYAPPQRFGRPSLSTDEGGLWAMMDREERKLKRGPFVIHDEALTRYVSDIACRLAGEHCPDVRVYLVRTPWFNANMAPNGMMQVWSGLLLRVDNEAQLAAVLGHEIGHYLQRHSLEKLRDLQTRAGFAQFLGMFGLAGALGQLAMVAGMFAYGRDQERQADQIGAWLMHRAGYDVGEAAKVWDNLLGEVRAREGPDATGNSPFFATHPAIPERRATLDHLAQTWAGGESGEERYVAQITPWLPDWLHDEVKRGQHEESLVLLSRQIARGRTSALLYTQRGEVYRLRNRPGDFDAALADFQLATQQDPVPADAWRGIGLITRERGDRATAAEAFRHYLELAPDAPDAAFVKTYVTELSS